MELRQLQCLVTCAQTESFSKAATILFTSQSNVSKTISSLEGELGIKIFERRQYGIKLTEKGRQICQYALSMLACGEKILDCAKEQESEELRICFQPSSWFAFAFCTFYIKYGGEGRSFHVTSATVEEMIRRLYHGLDQSGYAYIEERQLEKLKDVFQANHIGCYLLKKTRNVLYYGREAQGRRAEETEAQQLTQEEGTDALQLTQEKREEVLRLIQGSEDSYSGLSLWKEQISGQTKEIKPRVVITTNSDYIMQEILRRTELGNISPEYLSHSETCLRYPVRAVEGIENHVWFVCMFRNDRTLEELPKQFLNFIRGYLEEK